MYTQLIKMVNLIFTLLLANICFITNAVKNSTKSDPSTCKEYLSRGYIYKQYFEISELSHTPGYILDLHFSVQSSHDAHILLTPQIDLDKKEPVYEIVLGAGRNTFSDIRRMRSKGTKITARTPGLLSIFEMKSFWLHISTDGLIEVGREGEDLAFISWKDTSPLSINYLSFSSWSGVEAKWLFDCKPLIESLKNDTEGTHLNKLELPLTEIERLRKQLLTGYDPYVIPEMSNPSGILLVFLQFTCNHIFFDENKLILTLQGYFNLTWQDEKMVWNASDFDDIQSLTLAHREIWMPADIALYNGVGIGKDITQPSAMKIDSNGNARWVPKSSLKVWCTTDDIEYWPYNEYTCQFLIGFGTKQNLVRLLSPLDATLNEHYVLNGWELTEFITNNSIRDLPWITQEDTMKDDYLINIAVNIDVKIKRQNSIYGIICFSVIFTISTLLLIVFWVSPISNAKISLCSLIIILLCVLLLALSKDAPTHPTYVPGLIKTCQTGIVATAVALIISVVVIHLSRNMHYTPLPQVICNILSHPIIQTALQLPNAVGCDHYGKLNSSNESTTEIQDMWIAFGIAIDRVAFVGYTILIAALLLQYY